MSDCNIGGKIVDKIKDAHGKGFSLGINGLSDKSSELIASNIKIDNTTYRAIKFKNYLPKGKSVSFKPSN